MLLMNPDPQSATYSQYANSPPSRPNTASSRQNAGLLAANPTSQATEEAVKVFMGEVRLNTITHSCLFSLASFKVAKFMIDPSLPVLLFSD